MSVSVPISFLDTRTAFSTLPAQFPNANDKLRTKQFLSASSATVTLVEKFGKVFSPVTYDMNVNITKLTYKYEEDKQQYEYIEDMILKEQEAGEGVIDDTLSERCSPDLTPLIKNAYSATLEEYHGWLGTQLFNVLSRFAPNRRHLFYTLALESSNHDSFVIRDMQAFIGKMKDCVRRLRQFYQTHNLESYANL